MDIISTRGTNQSFTILVTLDLKHHEAVVALVSANRRGTGHFVSLLLSYILFKILIVIKLES